MLYDFLFVKTDMEKIVDMTFTKCYKASLLACVVVTKG
jgi:hypothetical protein